MDFRRQDPTGRRFQGCRAIAVAIFVILWFATLICPGYVYSQTGFSLSADANGAPGDQGVTALGTSPEQRVSIQLFGRNLRNARGVSVRFEYDVSQAVYEASENGDVLPNAQVLVEKGTNPTFVKVSFASLAGRATATMGLVGTIHFCTTAAFEGTTIRLTLAELGRGGPIERLPLNLNVEVSSGPVAPSPDLDGDGRVGFSDFLIFAEHFGTQQGDGQYAARIDLDSDGGVGFSDFLIFAEAFGAFVETPSGFAPADQSSFNRLVVGKRILLETFFLDVVSAGRFAEGFRRHEGRYAYTNTGANSARFTQTYDNPELFGGRCTTQLTFTSPTTGTARFTCDNGATGESENWSLSDLATPMFLRAAPDTLHFAFRDTWPAGQARAYDLALRQKTPRGRWNEVCITYSNRSDKAITAYARPWIYSPDLEPNTTYEFRYRYRNSSSCDTGSPGPWSPIVEGATPGSGTGGGGGGGGGGGRPDLIVVSPSVSDNTLTTGQSFTLSATVRNQGNGQAAATTLRYYRSTNATFSTSDTEVGTDLVSSLAASRTSSESISLTAPSSVGTYYYGACVESVRDESDTGNNCSVAVTVSVVAALTPDLVVGSLSASNSSPPAGASFRLVTTVRNQGTGQSAASILRFYRSDDATISASDTEVGSYDVPILGVGGSAAAGAELTAPSSAGTYYYGACVESVSGESDTGNNCSAAVTVTVVAAPAPDLVVVAPTVSTSSPTAGASFTLSAAVRNQGNGQAAATTLRYYLSTDATVSTSDTEVGTDLVSSLAASRTSSESISLTAPSSAGTYYYGACVESVSGESDTGNNCSAAVTVTVATVTPPATGTLKLYWTDWGTDKIQRADPDGSNVEDLISGSGLNGPDGLSLDLAGGKLYWADSGTNKIQRANLDGSGIEDLVTDQDLPFGLALDVSGGKMYWTNRYPGKIQRANLDGTGSEDLVTAAVALPGALALDVAGGKMYWASVVLGGQSKIQRADLNGSNVEDLVTSGLISPFGLALDVAGDKIYWTDRGTDKIQRADLSGSNVEDLVTSGLSSPNGIALDLAGGKIYWADAETDKVQRANLDGTGVEDLLTSSDGLVDPSSIALGAEAVSGGN